MPRHFTVALLFLTGIAQLVSAQTVTTIVNNGPSTNRVDLVVLGDGYTTADLPKYAADVQQFVLTMFQQQPYLEYQPYFNVHRIDVVSADSGVDHPETNTYKNTALDAFYNCEGTQRLICVDVTKVFNIVDTMMLPSQRDMILVLVNDSAYGGAGYFVGIAVSATNIQGVELVLHELGHSFGLLADEYGGEPARCNSSVEPQEPNATRFITGPIKWAPWIDAGTPIPTLSTTPSVPGLYEGAKYCNTGLYRPTYNSKMRSLDKPFEQINTEQLVKRYYNWASPIESSSPTSTEATVTKGQTIGFSIMTLRPAAHTLDSGWFVDGEPKATGGVSYVLDSALFSLGDHSVRAMAHDSTTMVRSDPDAILTESVTWALRVLPSHCDVNVDGTINVVDVQLVVNQTLGVIPPTSDINQDGDVNVVDLMIVVNSALGRSCPADG